MTLRSGLALSLVLAACAPSPARSPALRSSAGAIESTPPAISSAARLSAPPAPPLVFAEDDVAGAVARARKEKKALFVDAWAPWCHTCLSMKAYVFGDPSLRALADRVVFASIDTDRETNAAFLERHAVHVWPTIFLIDPEHDSVIGYWPGSASAVELKGFIEDALSSLDASKPEGDPARELATAQRAYAAREDAKAVDAYALVVASADAHWPRRSEALVGWIQALRTARRFPECVEVGRRYLGEVRGAAIPADFSGDLLMCADELPAGEAKDGARTAAIGRLREFLRKPPADASADDIADAWATLGEALHDMGDASGAHNANEMRLAVMEKAAASAPNPEAAATYDYGRAGAYVALGRGDEAVKMLKAREAERPDGYEASARLASVLVALGRYPEALATWGRAIEHSYGPRKLRYLKQKGEVLIKMADLRGAITILREEVKGYEALPAGASQAQLDDARRRLGNAEHEAAGPTPR